MSDSPSFLHRVMLTKVNGVGYAHGMGAGYPPHFLQAVTPPIEAKVKTAGSANPLDPFCPHYVDCVIYECEQRSWHFDWQAPHFNPDPS